MKIKASYHQERLWLTDKFASADVNDSSPVWFNIPLILEIEGTADTLLLEQSVQAVIKRHEALRTRMITVDNAPFQSIESELKIIFQRIDLRNGGGGDLYEQAVGKALEEVKRPFLADGGALVRAALIQFGDKKYLLVIAVHHLISDRFSLQILAREIMLHYKAYLQDELPRLPELSIHYADFSLFQQELPEDVLESLLFYWKRQLSGKIQALELPTDFPRSSGYLFHEGRQSFKIPPPLCMKIRDFNQERGSHHFILLLAAFKVLLHWYSNQEEIIVLTNARNRNQPGTENVIGPIANLLILRSRLASSSNFMKFFSDLNKTVKRGFENQDMPFERLVRELNVKQNMVGTPLFEVLFQYEDMPVQLPVIHSVKVKTVETNLGWGNYHLNLLIQGGETCQGFLVYNKNLFKPGTISRFIDHYVCLIEAIVEDPDRPVSRLPFLTGKERQQLLVEWNRTAAQYPKDKTIHQLFTDQAERAPDRIAVLGANHSTTGQNGNASPLELAHLTYRELNGRSGRLAHLLGERGVRPVSIAALILDPFVEMIIALLGILKAGAAYLPIDPHYPEERIQYMLTDSSTELLLTSRSLFKAGRQFGSWQGEIVCIEEIEGPGAQRPVPSEHEAGNLLPETGPSNLAYVIYTSGTTGKPKGCMVSHRNVVRLMHNDRHPFDFNHRDVWIMAHSYCFDFSVWEMYGALLYGGRLVIPQRDNVRDIGIFLAIVKAHNVTVLNQTPGSFYRFVEEEMQAARMTLQKHLRYVVFGGERLDPGKLKSWAARYSLKDIALINMFGITETTVHVTFYKLKGEDVQFDTSPIGVPIPETSVYICDPDLNLVPVGVSGEMYVGGSGVCKGYLNRSSLTAGRFIKNPWQPAEIFYRTGDLARWTTDGILVYMGRNDEQVKIRGYRVELGEIENRLLEHEKIKEAVVVAKEEKNGDRYLCAYITMSSKEQTIGSGQLREYLSQTLPDYMIPSYFVTLDRLPMTPNRKIDRKALPEPDVGMLLERQYQAPRDEVEKKLVHIWSELLSLEKEKLGIESDFLELGGHSLKATTLISGIHKEFDVKVPLVEVFKSPTIGGLAEYIRLNRERAVQDKFLSIRPTESREYYPLSSAQKRMYVLYRLDVESIGYNIPFILELTGGVEKGKLENACLQLIERHESLRTSFAVVEEEPVQRIHDPRTIEFEIEYHSAKRRAHSTEREEVGCAPCAGRCASTIENFIRPFDLSRPPLLRVGLIKVAEKKHILMMDMHHIITDGSSQSILLKDFMVFFRGYELPFLYLQYKDFSRWQQGNITGQGKRENLEHQASFWLAQFAGEIPVLKLPYDFARPAVQSFAGSRLGFYIDSEETGNLKALALKENATLFMVLLSILNVLMFKLSGQEDVIVGSPVAARRHADLQQIIGMFVNTLAFRNYPVGCSTFEELLRSLRQRTLACFENQEYPFEDLVDQVVINRDLSRNPLFDVLFVLQNMEVEARIYQDLAAADLEVSPYRYESGISKFDLTLYANETNHQLYLELEYCISIFKEETIRHFINFFRQVVSSVIKNPGSRLNEIEILSPGEKRQLLFSFNKNEIHPPRGKVIHEIFEKQAAKTPNQIALVGQDSLPVTDVKRVAASIPNRHYLSYKELNEKANRLCHVLWQKGVTINTIIGIMMDRSFDMLVGLLAILKTGAAYLPVEPGYPEERKRYMLVDSKASVCLTVRSLDDDVKKLRILDMETIFFDELGIKQEVSSNDTPLPLSPPPPTHSLQAAAIASNPVYIIYTSGSTGIPKGVLVEQGGVVNLLFSLQKAYPLLERDTYLFKTSFLFDVSVTELFGWFLEGGRLAILEKGGERDPEKILAAIEGNFVTHINFVPSMFNVFVGELTSQDIGQLSSLKYIFLAGEALLPEVVNKFRSLNTNIALENIYGPTEGTVYSSRFPLSRWDGKGSVPIGTPMENVKLFILDKYDNLQPIGLVGELVIGGAGLARGYVNKPELTAEKFKRTVISHSSLVIRSSKRLSKSTNDSSSSLSPNDQCPMTNDSSSSLSPNDQCPMTNDCLYKTGDLARWLPDGNIEFHGRIDHQVKIRGFRIELGEIENRLMKHEQIREAVVLSLDGGIAERYLCAYIVAGSMAQGARAAAAKRSAPTGDGPDAAELRQFLSLALPDYMVPAFFVHMEEIPLTSSGKVDRNALPEPELKVLEGLITPRNEVEKKLAGIWSEVLGVKDDKMGIDRDFFELGGHSFKVITMAAKIQKELGVKLSLTEIFRTPTIRGLARSIRGIAEDKYESIEPSEKKEYYPLSSAQKRLFILNIMEGENATNYNMPNAISITGKPDKLRLVETFRNLIERHESLRTAFRLIEEKPIQIIYDNVDFNINFGECDPGKIEEKINRFIRPFDLNKAPLLRVELLKVGEENDILMVDMHHIISDGNSAATLVKEFGILYRDEVLSPLKIQYKDFSEWHKKLTDSQAIRKQEDYWLSRFKDNMPILNFPTDYPRPSIRSTEGDIIPFQLSRRLIAHIKDLTRETDTTLYMVLLAVYNILISKYSFQEDIVVGTPVTGRSHADLQYIIGTFANMLAMRNFPEGTKTFSEFLKEVRENALKAYQNQDFQFEELIVKLGLQVDPGRNPLFDVVLNLVNVENDNEDREKEADLIMETYKFEKNSSKYDLLLRVFEDRDSFHLTLEYSIALFKRSTVESILKNFTVILDQVIENKDIKLTDITISNDFVFASHIGKEEDVDFVF